jgi:transcriptional regulator with XRE-family HTH domain
MTLGEKIKITRLNRKISQQELGRLANTHQKNISKYEQDMVTPSALTLKAIADALEVTTDFLLGNELENTIRDKALLQQFKEIDTLEEKDKEALMRVIAAFIRDTKTRLSYS